MSRDELYLNKREYRLQEIINPPLWFQGYSMFRTAWCKKWVALVIFDPEFSQKQVNIDELYQSILFEWQLHHYPNEELGIKIPNPPQMDQLEAAVKYFYYKQVVIETVIPSTRLFSEYSTRQDNRLIASQQKDSMNQSGIIGKVSHKIKRQLMNLLS
jgi:hypothetical protein